jgi:biopolymer transport protein ExbB
MTLPLVFIQAQAAANPEQGWLTTKLLSVTLSSAEWVLWLLVLLSVVSIAMMVERFLYFSTHRLADTEALALRLSRGDFEGVKAAIAGAKGMEAAVIRTGIESAPQGADAVEEVLASTVSSERPQYERFLSFLGTLGNNAPFVGLFGTVLGIIKAFHDLGQMNMKGAAIQQTVMAGISEALVATAVGLAVAIPAVVAYNSFTRSLKSITASTNALSHAIVGHLKSNVKGQRVGEAPIREVR